MNNPTPPRAASRKRFQSVAVSVRNPQTGLWEEVWSGTAAPAAAAARIFTVPFPQTSFPVDAIRIDLSSATAGAAPCLALST